jgi:hypothetical protein
MKNKEDKLENSSSGNYKYQLEIWFKAYNISREKLELFHDFIFSLHDLIDMTFLGIDVLEKEIDQKGHFNWCWKKTIENFDKEKIHFKENGDHFIYFWNFFYEAFYFSKLENQKDKIPSYIEKVFEFQTKKTKSELEVLLEIYKILNQNLKNK